MTNLVQRAADYARQAHNRIDQRRKYNGLPYIIHPESVAKLVSSVTDDPVTISAAWLHDVVEDTPVVIGQIEEEFGRDVATLVSDLTDIAKPEDGNRKVRKQINRAHTAQADPRAKTVKLADIIYNIMDVSVNDPKFAKTFIKEKILLLKVLKEGDAILYKRACDIIETAKIIVFSEG